MGSIGDIIECPHCGNEAHSEYYYKTGEEFTVCNNCGYQYSSTIINRDKLLNELTDEDWEIVEVINPYAAFRIKICDAIGYQCGSLENEEQLNELKAKVFERDDVEYFGISQYINNEIKVTTFIDEGPEYDSAGFSEEDR